MAPELPDDLEEEVREFVKKKKEKARKPKMGPAKPLEPKPSEQPEDLSDALGRLQGMLPEEDLAPLMESEAEPTKVTEPEAEAEIAEPEVRIYVVEKGDSLWKIAESFYGDGTRWKEIYRANKDRIEDPKVIRRGQKLRIP